MVNVEFTKEQYENLLKLVYLGNWVVNSGRVGDEVQVYFEDLERFVFSKAEQFGLGHFADTTSKDCPATREFEEGIEKDEFLEDYNEENFWNELIERITLHKVSSQFTEEEWLAKTEEEKVKLLTSFEEEFSLKFQTEGLATLFESAK